jgi:lycopene beta-cyclase
MNRRAFNPEDRIAVLGAGCAGLALADALLARFPSLSIDLYDRRTEHSNDRTWCFWDHSNAGAPWISRRWSSLRVFHKKMCVRVDCGPSPYTAVRASDYSEHHLARLKASRRARVILGAPVERIMELSDGVTLAPPEDEGSIEPIKYAMVFDGRPPARGALRHNGATLIQRFVGHEVVFDSDTLDPSSVTLMDFRVDQTRGIHFMYVLPFTPRRALVESTFFIRPDMDDPTDTALIDAYCRDHFGTRPLSIERKESGALPMTASRLGPKPTDRVWPIGTRAGVMRPSTGYAFDAIQRDTKRVVDALESDGWRPSPPRPPWATAMDRMLLSLLVRQPARAPSLFAGLFERAPSEALIRFLSDRATPADALRVISAMPKRAMTAHVLRNPRVALG